MNTINYNFMTLITKNDNDIYYDDIKDLINQGADIHYNNDYPLYLTTLNNNLKTVILLLENNCKVNYDTFLASVYKNNIDVVKLFLKKNININKCEAIRISIINNNVEMFKLLLLYNRANFDEILNYNIFYCNLEFIKILKYYGANFSKYKILFDICNISKNDSHYEIIKYLLENGAKLDIYNTNPISWCIKENNKNIIKLFLDNKININNKCVELCYNVNIYDSHIDIIKLFNDNKINFDYDKFNKNNIDTINLFRCYN